MIPTITAALMKISYIRYESYILVLILDEQGLFF